MLKRINNFIDMSGKKISNSKYFQILEKYNLEINFAFLVLSILLFVVFYPTKNIFLLVWANEFLWLHNIIFSLKDIKKRFLFFMFHITYFLFILGRPLFTVLKKWNLVVVQIEYGATLSGVIQSFKIIYISLLFIFIGTRLIEWYKIYKDKKINTKNFIELIEDKIDGEQEKIIRHKINHEKINIFRFSITIVLVISFVADLSLGIEKLIYILNNSYVDSYLNFQSQIPYIVYVLSSFFEYAVYLYLATFPKKKNAYLCMTTYVISNVPSFVGGERNPICLAILFCVIYVIIRHYFDEEVWIRKEMVIIAVICVFFGMIALGAMNYYREGSSVGSLNPFSIIEDFIYKQGVTFSWISVGFSRMSLLRSQGVISYTFGGLIDYVTHNKITQILFGVVPLSNTNSLEMVKYSNEMSHHLSYVALGEKYLQGHGTGTSYLLEVFTDFGWIGIVVSSILLGILFYYSYKLCTGSYKSRVFIFCMITGILFMPRGETVSCISFLWRIAFWACLILCICLYCFIVYLKKRKVRVKL